MVPVYGEDWDCNVDVWVLVIDMVECSAETSVMNYPKSVQC